MKAPRFKLSLPPAIVACLAPLQMSIPPTARAGTAPATPVSEVVSTFDGFPKLVRLPDGSLSAYLLRNNHGIQEIVVEHSRDDGRTWGETRKALELRRENGAVYGNFYAFIDRGGEVHLFFLNDANTGTVAPLPPDAPKPERLALDIVHVRTDAGRTRWLEPRRIWQGRSGDIQSVIQLDSGRIVVPICYESGRTWSNRGEGFDRFTFMGQLSSGVLYSDDGGETWRVAPKELKVVAPDSGTYGAIEPVPLQLKDRRVWMLLRTQVGRFYETFSPDGIEWSDPRPTSILSSDSPAGLVRLKDGRIVMLWNNCLRFPYAYGGRHVLHAAISDDEGRTWRGYLEVARDPYNRSPPPLNGDHGVSYAYPMQAADGQVLFTMWVAGRPVRTGEPRRLIRFDPAMLLATHKEADFAHAGDEWSTFGTKGVGIVPHPDRPASRVLSIRKADAAWPAGAVWNFPIGASGVLRMRVRVGQESSGIRIGLTDHFSVPFDDRDVFNNIYEVNVSPSNGRVSPPPDRWIDLELAWNRKRGVVHVTVDGRDAGTRRSLRDGPGVCYLRIRPLEPAVESGSVLIESVSVDLREP